MATRIVSSKAVFKKRTASNLFGQLMLGACVLGAAFIVTTNKKPTQAPHIVNPIVTDFDSVQLQVPSEPVAAGTKVRDIKFKKISYPKHQIPIGALVNFDEFLDSVVIATLPANLPMFQENLTQVGRITNPVLERIPLGMRAMTIRVDATTAVEGWAGSGSVVDILLIEKDRTSVVAEKVHILSAERSVIPVEGQASPTVPSTVTLLVTQDQCLAINTAIPLGKIAFALRSERDEDSWSDTEFNSSELMSKPALTKDDTGNIKGVLSLKGDDNQKAFALSNGRWIKTDIMPQGFFVNEQN